MKASTNEAVDYGALHVCGFCKTQHYLAVLPVRDGWVVGVRCACRGVGGGPRPYSRETGPLDYQQAERELDLLMPQEMAA